MNIGPVISFFDDLERNPKRGIAYSAALFVLSILLLFVVPNLILASYDDTTAMKIQKTEENIQKTEERAPEQMWFANHYLILDDGRAYKQTLVDAKYLTQESGGARSYYDKAKNGWPANRIRLYESAQSKAQQANDLVDSVVTLFDRNDNLRQQVVINQQSITEAWNSLEEEQVSAQMRFDNEAGEFLLVYMNPLSAALKSSEEKLQSSDQFIANASGYMPNLTNLTHQGDPQKAQEELDHAQALINEIVTLQAKVTSGLDYQVEARDNAKVKADEASKVIRQANQNLANINSQYNWGFAGALLQSSSSVANAQVNVDLAYEAIKSLVPVENKTDWPVAYEAAKLSLIQAQDSLQAANQQVSLFIETNDLLVLHSQLRTGVDNDISSAVSAWNVIAQHHSSTVWENKQGNLDTARNQVTQSETARDNSSEYLRNQQFFKAKSQADEAVNGLRGASTLCDEVVSLKNSLEDYRSWWPSKEAAASSTIESNRSKVNSYGSYSWSAKSDFDDAVSYLSSAQSHAFSREYEQACSLADQAEISADGTGRRAKNAYDSEMARQEAERVAAAAAAQRAADAAAQQASDSSGYSSSSSSGGGSSSYSSSDGGGYGSSSSGYSDGGGYD